MATKKKAAAFSHKKSLTKAFTLGVGAALVQFRRGGSARAALRARVEGTYLQWQEDDKSVPVPMASGTHTVKVTVGGSTGHWVIRAISPPGTVGGQDGDLPGDPQSEFDVDVP